MKNYNLTIPDLLRHLEEQMYFLDISLSNFASHKLIDKFENKDLGLPFFIKISTEIEAKRIATSIRVMTHDTDKSKSLLKHLNIKNNMEFIDSAAPNDGKLHSMTGMIGVRGSSSDGYYGLVAKINNEGQLISVPLYKQHLKEWYKSYQKVSFNTWWDNIIIDVAGLKFSRYDIVKYVANKDGGAHIDKDLPDDYFNAKNSPLNLNISGIQVDLLRNVVYASVAQIGWELLNSIDNSTLEEK